MRKKIIIIGQPLIVGMGRESDIAGFFNGRPEVYHSILDAWPALESSTCENTAAIVTVEGIPLHFPAPKESMTSEHTKLHALFRDVGISHRGQKLLEIFGHRPSHPPLFLHTVTPDDLELTAEQMERIDGILALENAGFIIIDPHKCGTTLE